MGQHPALYTPTCSLGLTLNSKVAQTKPESKSDRLSDFGHFHMWFQISYRSDLQKIWMKSERSYRHWCNVYVPLDQYVQFPHNTAQCSNHHVCRQLYTMKAASSETLTLKSSAVTESDSMNLTNPKAANTNHAAILHATVVWLFVLLKWHICLNKLNRFRKDEWNSDGLFEEKNIGLWRCPDRVNTHCSSCYRSNREHWVQWPHCECCMWSLGYFSFLCVWVSLNCKEFTP